MPKELTVVSGKGKGETAYRLITCDESMEHFKNVVCSVCEDAQQVWGEVWRELQGSVTDGYLILPDGEKGFKPKCGWPEFLEKIWLMKHYIDYARKLSATQQEGGLQKHFRTLPDYNESS
jgi:hypothetical protein